MFEEKEEEGSETKEEVKFKKPRKKAAAREVGERKSLRPKRNQQPRNLRPNSQDAKIREYWYL